MTVLVLTAVPPSLRGVLTRWLFEIAPGVFVGHVSVRVRGELWLRVVEGIGRGRAILVNTARNEQRLEFRTYGHDWEPVDYDGIALMLRRAEGSRPERGGGGGGDEPKVPSRRGTPRNWSHAERRLRGRG